MATQSPFPAAVRETLVAWFSQHGGNPLFEIEGRIRDVGGGGFERVLSGLKTHRGWSNTPAAACSLDKMHATGVRETVNYTADGPTPAEFMRKQKLSDVTVSTPFGYDVRFQLATESNCAADPSPVHLFRHKERHTFEHKGLFKFDLTRVKQGSTDQAARTTETQHEVEVEFCGQQMPEAARAEYLADSLMMKVADLLQQLTHAPRAGQPDAKRQRSANGPLQEGDEVAVAAGTEVQLEPSGHAVPLRFNGEMPAELVPRWLFSHLEADGRAHIMSEPARIGDEHFPLFYFCGSVPAAALKPRNV